MHAPLFFGALEVDEARQRLLCDRPRGVRANDGGRGPARSHDTSAQQTQGKYARARQRIRQRACPHRLVVRLERTDDPAAARQHKSSRSHGARQ